jgi:hypothetical protein
MYFNVFECIYRHCNWISPSLSHCNVFSTYTHLHIFFPLYTMTPSPTCYTTTFLFFHSHWSIPIFIQSILTFHVYTSPHIPHSTFYVVTGCAEHSRAQVLFSPHQQGREDFEIKRIWISQSNFEAYMIHFTPHMPFFCLFFLCVQFYLTIILLFFLTCFCMHIYYMDSRNELELS